MDALLPDWNFDVDLPLCNPKKSLGADDELTELVWQNGQVVLHSQSHKKPSHGLNQLRQVHKHDQPMVKKQSNLVQDEETMSWLQCTVDDYFETEFCSQLLADIPSSKPVTQYETDKLFKLDTTPNPNLGSSQVLKPVHPVQPDQNFVGTEKSSTFCVPTKQDLISSNVGAAKPALNNVPKECSIMTFGSSHCGSNQVANEGDMSRMSSYGIGSAAFVQNNHTGKVHEESESMDLETLEQANTSSSGGSGSSFQKLCSVSRGLSTHKRKVRDGEEPECQSETAELESRSKCSRKSSTTRKSRAAEVHNLSERRRRDRINEKMKALQELIPHSDKSDKASMLDEAIEYMKSLQLQLQMMWMGRSGMAPMLFPGMQHYMSRMGMGIGSAMLPSMPNAMHLPTMPFADPALNMPSTSTQSAMHQNPLLNAVNFQNQTQNPLFSEQFANYMTFHPMQNTPQQMNMFGFGSHTPQPNQPLAPPGNGSSNESLR